MKNIKDKYYKATEKALYNYSHFKINIINMKEELESLKDDDGVGAISYEGEKTSETFKINRQVEDQSIRNINKEKYLRMKIKLTENEIRKIDRALEGLTEKERKIIELRYMKGYQWFNIAYEVQYNERYCRTIKRCAIENVAKSLYGMTAVFEPDFP
ncbi:hypothetical protein GOQ27_06985 [Clostridium sp. D2Q-11]|uniref:RNA polymerase sigma factor, sigma-70 family n=1 Tax=Anaeromonas frigoriresistens TaxID=2683708 RepID=A0A942UXK9_9FIRM|nr:hypothetical protein [Anaeromonas frigoriresistens]MBS4538201.1 hypothetical protein [Anaeromonas frigoriresistens]